MEASDIPLIVPIQATINNMFADSLQELEALKEKFSAADEDFLKAQQVAEDEAAEAEAAAAQAAQPAKGKAAAKQAKGKGKDTKPEFSLPTEEELLKQKQAEMERKKSLEPPPTDPYRKLAGDIAQDEEDYINDAQPHSEFIASRLEYLAAKPNDQYMIEDLLGEWVENGPGDTHPGCIDAAALAAEHTSKLSEKYGYKLPRGLHEVGKVDAVEEDELQTRDLLSTHGAGGASMDKAFVCVNTIVAPSVDAGQTIAAESTQKEAATVDRTPVKPKTASLSKKDSTKKGLSISQKAALMDPVECSAKQLSFVDCLPGHSYEQIVTFWNRDTALRLFKLSPTPSPLIQLEPLTANYNPETTIAPGCSVQFKVIYNPVDAARVDVELCLGHARDSNRINAEMNQLAQWSFFNLPVACTALEPKLVLLNDSQNDAINEIRIDPTFVHSRTVVNIPVINLGGAADFTLSIPLPFVVEPENFTLQNNEMRTISICFAPEACHRDSEESLRIVGNLAGHTNRDGEVVSECPVVSMGVIPSIWLEGIGTATLDPYDTNTEAVPEPPLMMVEDACLGFTSQKTVCVRNDSPLPVSFSWDSQITRKECGLSIFPAEGVLAPERSTVFTVELLPDATEKVEGLFKLLLHGLPTADDVPFLSRKKPQPVLGTSSLTDPFRLFGSPMKQKPEDQVCEDVYCCAVRLAADPMELSAHIAPAEIVNSVPMLIRQPNYREFTIVNGCNRELEFWLDPPRGEEHPSAVLDEEAKKRLNKKLRKLKELFGPSFQPPQSYERDGVELTFSPQRGTVPGNSSITVGVTFTMNTLGPHDIDVECYLPQLPEKSQSLMISTIAKGPTAHTSTDLIDFGIVPLGEEAEARMTITNHNPIPINFRCIDPEQVGEELDTARYIFLPPSGALRTGQSVELTVYRRGDAVGNMAEEFEIAVHEGESTMIACRANIQKPTAFVTPSVVNFGTVERDIPSYQEVRLANLSAVDIQYELIVVDAPPTVAIAMNKPVGLILAGETGLPVSVEATFRGELPSKALIALHSPQLSEPVPFEVYCEKVNQLSISLCAASSSTAVADQPPIGNYIAEMLHNLVSTALDDLETNVKAHCDEIKMGCGIIPDNDPYCTATAVLSVSNHSGCNTKYHVSATNFVPVLPAHPAMEATGTLAGTQNQTVGGKTIGTATKRHFEGTSGLKSMNGTAMGKTGTLRSLGGTRKSGFGTIGRKSNATAKSEPKEKKLVLKADNPTFTCKQLDGREQEARDQNTVLLRAQNLLLDGKGCAVDLRDFFGDLGGNSLAQVNVDIVANMPGQYHEQLAIECDGVPPVNVDLSFAVKGKPIVVDPYTSGLAMDADSGLNRLLLPSMVGGMSSVKRKLRITSRCPRDLVVEAKLFENGCFFDTAAIDADENNCMQVSLNVLNRDIETTCGTTTPSEFILPALETAEVAVEYSPPKGALGSWQGNLVLSSKLAPTAFNDKFLLDEFYHKNKSKYPSTRSVAVNDALSRLTNERFQMRGVPKILVKHPLIDRPGIVHSSNIVFPDEAQIRMAKQDHDSNGDDSDNEQDIHFDAEYEKRAKEMRDQFAREEEERSELIAYIENGRVEKQKALDGYLLPTEILVVANNVEPKLVSDPEKILRFPMCQVGGKCDRTMRLTNPFSTPFDFRVECSDPFRIAKAQLLDADGASSGGDQNNDLKSSTLTKKRLPDSIFGSTKKVNPHSDPTATLFRLYPQQSVSVTVELTRFETTVKHQISGELFVKFSNGAEQVMPLLATVHVPTLVSEPETTWFRPSVQLDNGRPQPKYIRTVKLVNHSSCNAQFVVEHQPADRPISRGTETLTRLQKAQQTLKVSPLQQHALVLDDPTRFELSASNGVVPAATAGGAPGVFEIHVTFHESATSTFESKFTVKVDGGAGCDFILRGESKETEI